MDDGFEEGLHRHAPPSDTGSSIASVSLTDSHRDPSDVPPGSQIVSSDGAEWHRQCLRRACLLVPLARQLRDSGLNNRQVAATIAHRKKRCDRMAWPAFRDSVYEEMERTASAEALLACITTYNLRRLTANDNRRVRCTGSWRDPSKGAVEAVFSRLLCSQLAEDDIRCAEYAIQMVEASHSTMRFSGYWATLALNLAMLDRHRREQFWEWHRLYPRPAECGPGSNNGI